MSPSLERRWQAPVPGSLDLFVYFLQHFYGLRQMPSKDASFETVSRTNARNVTARAQPTLSPPTAPACEGLVRLAQPPGPLVCVVRVCWGPYKTKKYSRPTGCTGKGANLPLIHTFGS